MSSLFICTKADVDVPTTAIIHFHPGYDSAHNGFS